MMKREAFEGFPEPYEEFFNSLPEPCLIVHRDGTIMDLNRHAAAVLYKYGIAPFRGQTLCSLATEAYRRHVESFIRTASSGQIFGNCRVSLLAGETKELPASLTAFPLGSNGSGVGVTISFESRDGIVAGPEVRGISPVRQPLLPEWAADMPGAWTRGELVLYYQPQWNIATEELTGMEALLRWRHPRLGLIPPLEFIPYAEESGWIWEIGEWVIREAAEQNKKWQNAGFPLVPVSVNCSLKQFARPNIVGTIFRILMETRLDPRYLKLEITESVALMEEHDVIRKLSDFKNIQVRISLDDFGTGYSSLSYLHKMPVHMIKLDRSFLLDAESNPVKSSIVKWIIELAKSLNIKVLAEGLETKEQLLFLRRLGCEEAQGFYMNRPLSVEDLERHWRSSSLAEWIDR